VIIVLLISVWGLYPPFVREIRRMGGVKAMLTGFNRVHFDLNTIFYAFFIGLIAAMLIDSLDWQEGAKRVPIFVAWVTLIVASISFFNHTFRGEIAKSNADGNGIAERAAHLDIEVDASIEGSVVVRRAFRFLAWLVAFLVSTSIIGMLPTAFVFVIAYMRIEGQEPWRLVAIFSVGLTTFSWFLFEYLLLLPWPRSQIGIWFPVIKDYIPSM
jgi:hypothetical protein